MVYANPTVQHALTSRPLTITDAAELRAFLDAPEISSYAYEGLFFRSVLCHDGLDSQQAAFFGSFDEGELVAVMLIHGPKCHIIGHSDLGLGMLVHHLRRVRSHIGLEGATPHVQACVKRFGKGEVAHLEEGIPCRLTRQTIQSIPTHTTRGATLDDLPQILALEQQTGRLGQVAECVMRQPIIARRVCLGRVYVAEADRQIVSVAYADVALSPAAEICEVATSPSHRNRGLGTACVAALCRALLRERVEQIFLTYAKGNTAAARTYKKIGFRASRYGRRLRADVKW